ncbi:MAG: fluoride efflux transporter CrcB [Pseudomonadales bacterium]
MTVLWVAIGGALGAVARFLLASELQTRIDHQLLGVPASTLVVNIVGSTLIGVAYVLIAEKSTLNPQLQPLLMMGFLAAFTTFSTFSLDSVHLLEAGHYALAIGYIIASVVVCIGTCFVAMQVTRMI